MDLAARRRCGQLAAAVRCFFRDELPRHRLWACEIANTFGDPDVLPALTPLLNDDDGHVRKSAAQAHQAIGARS
ncbi:HEAT repeat domain-containing protein [Bradyrhizobium sp. 134]|uniref:HEAT repeat domain-containing protein n=1 Tax=Bradyrhizobium sp. 134 TaxID=2782611 RepID=UPI001FF75C9B